MKARDKKLGLKKPAPRGTLTEQNAFYRMLDQRNFEEAQRADINNLADFDQALRIYRFSTVALHLRLPL